MLSRRGATLEEMRYEDSKKVCFVPEAHRVVRMLHAGSEALVWGRIKLERHPGMGPYDTGAV